MKFKDCCQHLGHFISADEERGTGVSYLPLNTGCHLLGIKYRPEYPAINLIIQFIGLIRSQYGKLIVYTIH